MCVGTYENVRDICTCRDTFRYKVRTVRVYKGVLLYIGLIYVNKGIGYKCVNVRYLCTHMYMKPIETPFDLSLTPKHTNTHTDRDRSGIFSLSLSLSLSLAGAPPSHTPIGFGFRKSLLLSLSLSLSLSSLSLSLMHPPHLSPIETALDVSIPSRSKTRCSSVRDTFSSLQSFCTYFLFLFLFFGSGTHFRPCIASVPIYLFYLFLFSSYACFIVEFTLVQC